MMTLEQAIALGIQAYQGGRMEEAEGICRQIVAQVPGSAHAWDLLGTVLAAQKRTDAADEAFREALRLVPGMIEALNNRGLMLLGMGKLGEAVASFEEAVRAAPANGALLCNLAAGLHELGRQAEAIGALRRAIEVNPDFPALYDALVLMMHYVPGVTAAEIRVELERWEKRFAEPLATWGKGTPPLPRGERKRLRVGYVSADFREHSVGRFMAPVLAGHDRERVEVICFSDVMVPDGMRARLRGLAEGWCEIVGKSDEEVARMIREAGIDVLVDLSMHTHGNRLMVFARKPARVQATWLAYAGSTGLKAVDFRLGDRYLDPIEAGEEWVEKTVRLPGCFWCYEEPKGADVPEVVEPPVVRTGGGVTFGCLNNFAKVSEQVLGVWGRLMERVPGSRLVLHASEGSHRERVLQVLERAGVKDARGRVEFMTRVGIAGFLAKHGEIDVALDPFPFGGGTTTCDALWMGVPVVTLRGEMGVGRAGASILSHLGLEELVAGTEDEYIELAARLAGNGERLRSLRMGMRDRMRNSALMDAKGFVRGLENIFYEMLESAQKS